jgi:hypothetical protein
MLMPKAAMNEDQRFPSWKNDVWRAWKVFSMQSKSVAHLMQKTPNNDFRFRVLAANVSHHPASNGRAESIRHGSVDKFKRTRNDLGCQS